MSLGIYLRKSRGRADVNFFDRSLVALADGSDGRNDGAAERSRVEKALRGIPLVFFASAAAEYERAVDAFRSDEESHLVRSYIQNGNAFVTHKFRPLRKNNLVKVYIFFIIHYLWDNVNELRKKSAKKRGERRVLKGDFFLFSIFWNRKRAPRRD